jgi:hypothetical protein
MDQMDDIAIRRGLAKLGERLGLDHDVEILIVGGAAGILTGELPASMTTADADAICYRPAKDRDLRPAFLKAHRRRTRFAIAPRKTATEFSRLPLKPPRSFRSLPTG